MFRINIPKELFLIEYIPGSSLFFLVALEAPSVLNIYLDPLYIFFIQYKYVLCCRKASKCLSLEFINLIIYCPVMMLF
jgi:hypothetical protein